jgi:hypothetical protein
MYQTLKEKFSEKMKGNRFGCVPCSEEAKEKIRQTKIGSKNPAYGTKHSEEHRQKIS